MRRHDIRFPLRGRVWAAVPFFCACPLRREWAAVPFFLCLPLRREWPAVRSIACRQRVEHPVCAGRNCAACMERNLRSVRGGMCGLNGMEPPVCGGAECPVGGGGLYGETPDHAPQVSRAEGGMSRSADGGSRRRAGSGYVSRSARRARKDSGKRAASAAARWRQRPGPGGRRIPASEGKQKAVFVRKPLLSYDRMRYSLSGVTLT